MVQTFGQPHPAQQFPGTSLATGSPLQFGRYQDILQRSEGRQELEILEHESHVLVADPGSAIFIQRTEILPRQPHHTARGLIQTRAQTQQRRLPGTAGTDNGAGFARQKAQVDLVQNGQ